MRKWSLSSLVSSGLWGDVAPERMAYNCKGGDGHLACPLKGVARVQECATCKWASGISYSSDTASVRCNPSMAEVLARAQAAEF